MPRSFWFGVWLLLVPVWGAGGFEPYFVANARVQLYQGRHLVPVKLIPGEVFLARPHETHRDWLVVLHNGIQYDAAGQHFMSAVRSRTTLRQRQASLEHDIATVSERIADVRQRGSDLFAAEAAIRFDATVQYRIRELVPIAAPTPAALPSGPAQQGGGARRPGSRFPGQGAPQLEVRYRYEDKIGSSTARNQARRWQRERDELDAELARLLQRRAEHVSSLAGTVAEAAQIERRLAAFRQSPGQYLAEPYLTIRRGARLFADNRALHELEADVVLLGVPNREHPDWLRVRYRERIYDVKRERLRNRFELEQEFGGRRDGLRQQIADLEMMQEQVQARIGTLEAMQLAVDYESRLSRIPLRSAPLSRGNRYYLSPSCPADAVEMVNRSRARSLWRDWRRSLEDLRGARDRHNRQLGALRRELAGVEPKFEDWLQRLSAVSPGGGAGTGANRIDW